MFQCIIHLIECKIYKKLPQIYVQCKVLNAKERKGDWIDLSTLNHKKD